MAKKQVEFGPNPSALYSLEAEEAVLGSVLINPDAYLELADSLKAEDFYLHKHRWIWDVFVHLHDRHSPVDFITVSQELENRRQLEEAGGAAYLTHLLNVVPTSLHAEAYGRLVERDAIRRRLLESATAIAKLAYAEERDINEVVGEAEAAVFAVSARRAMREALTLGEAARRYFDRLHELSQRPGEWRGVPTGFADLDQVLGGLQKSDLILLAARPGIGKTSWALSVARHAALVHQKHVAVFSLEMNWEQLTQRLIAQVSGIDAQRLRLGQIRDDEWPLLVQASEALGGAPVLIDDTPGLTPRDLAAKCRRLDQEYGLDLVVVDYLQLMRGGQRFENRVAEVTYISQQLKQLARELNVPVLANAQLSRAIEQRADKRPLLSDLRESGSQEQDADVVLFLHRTDDGVAEKSGVAMEIMVAKQRNGPTHPGLPLLFKGGQTLFENAQTRRVDLNAV
jgi:replicative DNA helicase